jgi:hypothetical protein
MKRIVKERLFLLVAVVLLAVTLICFCNLAFAAGVVFLIVTLVYLLIVSRIVSGMELGHELCDLNKKFSSSEIISSIQSAFGKSWKPNHTRSNMSLSATYSKLAGLISGATIQVDLADNGNTWSLDVWVSDYEVKNGAVKFGSQISKLRDSIDEVLIKYIIE